MPEVLNNTQLLPCPFCGGEGISEKQLRDGFEHDRDDPDAYAYTVRCRSCAAEGGWSKSSHGGAAILWNMRHPVLNYETELTEAIEAARKYIVCLRQLRYAGKPEVKEAASKQAIILASRYTDAMNKAKLSA